MTGTRRGCRGLHCKLGFHIVVSVPAASPILCWDTSPLLTTIWKPGLKERNIVSTVSDLSIDAENTVAIQMQLTSRTLLTSDLLIESGFSKDNSYFVARILAKAQPINKKTTVQILNHMERSLFLPKNTEITDESLFVEEKNTNLEKKEPPSR